MRKFKSRVRLGKRKSRKLFTKTAKRVHPKNKPVSVKRGGIRL